MSRRFGRSDTIGVVRLGVFMPDFENIALHATLATSIITHPYL